MKSTDSSWPAGIKKTRQRVSVMNVLEHSDAPLSAMDICKQTETGDCHVWLSTVYRILDLFVKENIVLKTTIAETETALYELNRNKHKHYAVCLKCHKVVEVDGCPLEKYTPKLADSDFHVLGHKLEMYGYCKDCDKKK